MNIVEHPHVELVDGQPMVRGSKVPVRRLWYWHRHGETFIQILYRYQGLGHARILDALSFAYDNPDLIQADLTWEERWALADQGDW
jgi:uncharacterized protein (DUF433 family)